MRAKTREVVQKQRALLLNPPPRLRTLIDVFMAVLVLAVGLFVSAALMGLVR